MKKFLFVVVLFMMTGCSAIIPMKSSQIDTGIYIGMPLKEFLSFAGEYANLETLTQDSTVYSLDYSLEGSLGVAGKKLFHFDTEGKLIKMDSEDFRKLYLRSGEKEE